MGFTSSPMFIFGMEEYARILIEKNGLPSLKDSITIGKQAIERKLAVYQRKIKKFEDAKNMKIETFLRLFNNGKLGDGDFVVEALDKANERFERGFNTPVSLDELTRRVTKDKGVDLKELLSSK